MFGKETAEDHDSALSLPLGLYVLFINIQAQAIRIS